MIAWLRRQFAKPAPREPETMFDPTVGVMLVSTGRYPGCMLCGCPGWECTDYLKCSRSNMCQEPLPVASA
jgi:hypothetical protein